MNFFFKIIFLVTLTTTNSFSAGRLLIENTSSLETQSRVVSQMVRHREHFKPLILEVPENSQLSNVFVEHISPHSLSKKKLFIRYCSTQTSRNRFSPANQFLRSSSFRSGPFVQKRFYSANYNRPEEGSGFEQRFFDPRNDVAFKKVFIDHEDLTRSFLNSTLRLTGDREIEKVEFLPTERLPLTSESKKSILDVLCTDQKGFKYIIEVQNKYMQNYVQRVQYYVSHLYSGQLARGEDYLELKPVTLLSLLNHSIFPPDISYLSFYHNIEKETKKVI
jgi:hypothetical protein